MAKRQQTTGMPKKDRRRPEQETEPTNLLDRILGNPQTPAERETAFNQLVTRSVIAITAVLGGAILLVLLYNSIVVPSRAVATVNGERITVREFRQRLEFEEAYVLQLAQNRFNQLQAQANQFGIEVDQFLQNDQQFQQWNRELQFPDALGQRVIDDMVNDLLIEQALEERDLTVDENDIRAEENEFFGYDPTQAALIGTPATETPTPTASPTPFVSPTPTNTPIPTATPTATTTPTPIAEATGEVTPEVTAETTEVAAATLPPATLPPSPTPDADDLLEDFERTRDNFVEALRSTNDVSDDAIEDFYQRRAQRNLLTDELFGENTKTFVNARHILVETEEEATTIVEALNNGELFSALARARSTDTGSGSNGGELGWSATVNYVPEFRDAVESAELGVLVGPVESEFGFHIIQVHGREERELEGTELENIQAQQFQQWLNDQRDAADEAGEVAINDNWPNFLPTS